MSSPIAVIEANGFGYDYIGTDGNIYYALDAAIRSGYKPDKFSVRLIGDTVDNELVAEMCEIKRRFRSYRARRNSFVLINGGKTNE